MTQESQAHASSKPATVTEWGEGNHLSKIPLVVEVNDQHLWKEVLSSPVYCPHSSHPLTPRSGGVKALKMKMRATGVRPV